MFEELLTQPLSQKMDQQAPYDDIVVSTRIRLARNVAHYPFSTRMTEESGKCVNQRNRTSIIRTKRISIRAGRSS